MPTHNCETCEIQGKCPLESIAPWMNEHEEEGEQAVHGSSKELAKVCAHLVVRIPPPLVDTEGIVLCVETAFLLGYQKGRTYKDIPNAFKQM